MSTRMGARDRLSDGTINDSCVPRSSIWVVEETKGVGI